MKVTNKGYKSICELRKNLDLSHIDIEKTLIQVFSGFVLREEIQEIQKIFNEKNDKARFIGTTTAGEIIAGKAAKKTIVVSISEFEQTQVNYYHFYKENDFQLGVEIAQSVNQQDTKAVILFLSSFTIDATQVVKGITAVNADLPVAGGLAGDNGFFKETFVFNQQKICNRGAVIVSLNNQWLSVFCDSQLGWQPIGPVMTVTKVRKNRLYELDGVSVEQVYSKYLGRRIADKLPLSATEFPLVIDDKQMQICRIFTNKYADGSMQVVGEIKEGDKVRFSYAHIDSIIKRTQIATKKYGKLKPEVIFNYSCICRNAFLQENVSLELEHFNHIAATSGFFTYGEFLHKYNDLFLLNNTLTVLAISEKQNSSELNHLESGEKQDESDENLFDDKQFVILDALTHLTNTVIADLETSNSKLQKTQKILEDQANHDYLTKLYNRRYFNEFANNFIALSRRNREPLSVITLDIDYFKKVNDQHGHGVGDQVLKSLASILINNTRASDIVARFGGEEFTILLPLADIKLASYVAEQLRKIVENSCICCSFPINITISLGVAQFDAGNDKSILAALERADLALYQAKESGRNRVKLYQNQV